MHSNISLTVTILKIQKGQIYKMSWGVKDLVRPRKTVNSLQRGNPFPRVLYSWNLGPKICDGLSSRVFLSYFLKIWRRYLFLFQLEVKNLSNKNTHSRTLLYITPPCSKYFLMRCLYKPGHKLHIKKTTFLFMGMSQKLRPKLLMAEDH